MLTAFRTLSVFLTATLLVACATPSADPAGDRAATSDQTAAKVTETTESDMTDTPGTTAAPGTTSAPGNASASGNAPKTVADPPTTPDYAIFQEREDRVIARLPNRMLLVAQRVPTAPVVSAQCWVKTGSLYEQEHVGAGLSHFLEHLISGGSTASRTEAESNAILGAIGAQTNAATSLDTVRYYINTTTPHAATAVALLSDWLKNSKITPTEYEREREVIQREFSMGQGDPGRIQWKLTQQARYAASPGHPAAHPTIGYLDEFLTVSRDEIYDFYKRMYVPNNMVFVVTGDIDPQGVIRQLAQIWHDVPTGELPEVGFPAVPSDAEPTLVQGVADISRPRVRMLWPGVKLGAELDYALDLIATILSQGESSRLIRELRDERRLVSSIDAYNYSAAWGRGFFGVDYELAEPDAAEAVRSAIAAQLQRLQAEPVSDEELARAKRKTLARVIRSGQTAQAVASMLASDIISTADPDYRQKYAATIQDLTADDLMRAAKQKLDPDAASLVLLHPAGEDEEIPYPKRDPDATLTRDDWVEQIDLDNDTLLRKLKRKLADGSAEGRQAITVDPPVIRELSNGLTVIAQRSTVVPAVAVQLYTRGGLLADEPGQEGVANAAATMLMRGTTSRSAQDIATSLEDLGATLGSAAGNNTSYLRGTALADDWPTLLEIMADVALNPAFDEQEWQSVQPRLLAAVDRATDRWSGELRSRFREAYFADHPWSQTTLGRARVIRDLTPDKLREAHEQRLAAESSILAIVGDIDPERAFELAEQTFGKMPANAGESFEPPLPGEPASRVVFHPTAKPVAAVQIGLGPGITRDDPDYAALRVLSTVMGDFPSGWLQQELRGKGPGLAYAASVGNVTGIVPGYFTLLFNTDPANLVEATSRAMAIVDRARTQPILNVDLERAKAKVLTNEFAARQSNSDLAAGQALDRLYGIDDPTGQALLEQVQALTAADLRDVANRRLTDPVITIIANEPIETEAIEKLLPGENN